MNENGEFSYNDRQCTIVFFEKSFYLKVFKYGTKNELDHLIRLFPSERYSSSKRDIAFHVANLLVLPNVDTINF